MASPLQCWTSELRERALPMVKAATLGLGFNFKQSWQADLAYTSYFGGRTYAGTDPLANTAGQSRAYASSANPLKDRDFIAASLTYSF